MFMLGAKNFTMSADKQELCFMIRGCPKINCIRIRLTPNDLYNISFEKVGLKIGIRKVKSYADVYNDMLHEIIETETGLRTSL